MRDDPQPMTHFWRVRKFLPDRFGQHCRVIARGKLNSMLVEFADGAKFITIRYFARKLPAETGRSA